jgi:VWFA-related protein
MSAEHTPRSVVASIAVLAALVVATPAGQSQPPLFKASAESAWVTVTAIDDDGRLVTNLAQDEFVVIEEGVAQPITTFHSDRIPFAITVMFDQSGSMTQNSGAMRRSLEALLAHFRPGDRAIVGAFDSLPLIGPRFSGRRESILRSVLSAFVRDLWPCAGPWHDSWRQLSSGATALWDGVACAIQTAASDAETPRRVALIVTDGYDNVSVLTEQDVRAMAEEYGVMVYVIAMTGSQGVNTVGLRGLANDTGGGYFNYTQHEDLAPTFARVAEELRHQYVLGYASDAGAAAKIDVRVTRPGITARARRATMTSTPVSSALAAAVEEHRASAPPTTVPLAPAGDSVFDRFARGAWDPPLVPRFSRSDFYRLNEDIKVNGTAWIRAAGPEGESLRRLQVATFVLELLVTQDNAQMWEWRSPASDLIDWASSVIRHGPPTEAERLWHLAGIGLLQRFGSGGLGPHVQFALGRFPEEPRLILARALAEDLQLWPQKRNEKAFSVDQHRLFRLQARYREAADVPAVSAEARIRLGYIELRRGRVPEAHALFEAAGDPSEPFLKYLRHLFRGQAFEAAGQLDDAEASFRAAYDTVPLAQSATLSWAATLTALGRDAEAASLVNRMLRVSAAPVDPWTLYVPSEWRFWDLWMDELRKAARR